jgi:hypothetical protein
LIGDNTGTSGDKRFAIGVSIELSETIGDSIGASGDKRSAIGDGVLIELRETGLMTGGTACRTGVAKEDKTGSTTLVGRIGVSVGTRLMMGDEGRVGTAIVVLSSGVVSAGSIAATGNFSAGIRLWTTGDRTATRGETTGETKEATGDRTGRSGASTNDISGVGLWTTGDRAGRRGVTTADISGAKEDSGVTAPARVGILILVARVGTVGDVSTCVGGAKRALSTVGTMLTTGVTAVTTGEITGVTTFNTGVRTFTTGLVAAPKIPPRGSRGFADVTVAGVGVVDLNELDAGATLKGTPIETDGAMLATICKSGAGELVGKPVATFATLVDDNVVAGCDKVSPIILKAACFNGVVAAGCVRLPLDPSTLSAACVNEVVAGGCIKPPPNPSMLNPPGIVDRNIDEEACGCTKPSSPITLDAACVGDVAGGCIRPAPSPRTLKPPCWLDKLAGAVVVIRAATGSPTSVAGIYEGAGNPTRAAVLEDVCDGAATGKSTRAAGLEDAASVPSAAATGGATSNAREEATVSDLTKIPVRPLPPHACVGLPEHGELQELSSTAMRGILKELPHLQMAPSLMPKYLKPVQNDAQEA